MDLTEIYKTVFFYGEDILLSPKMNQQRQYRQHGSTSVYDHCLNVACTGIWLAQRLEIDVDIEKLVRGALLHDFFLYDWHIKQGRNRLHGLRHPFIALQNAAAEYHLSDIEKDIILKHMFPLTPVPPTCRESYLVMTADKLCTMCETFGIPMFRLDFARR